jgi:hypothetical protein
VRFNIFLSPPRHGGACLSMHAHAHMCDPPPPSLTLTHSHSLTRSLARARAQNHVLCWITHSETTQRDITNSMELSPFWEPASCAATRELPSILWNPKIHYRVHKNPPVVLILTQINPVHTTSSYLTKTHLNIIHPPSSWSSYWSLSFWISHQQPTDIPVLPIHATCPAISSFLA